MIEAAVEREHQKIRNEAMLIGEARGKAMGIKIGARKAAEAMLRTAEVSIAFISQVTGLTIEEVEQIQQEQLKH